MIDLPIQHHEEIPPEEWAEVVSEEYFGSAYSSLCGIKHPLLLKRCTRVHGHAGFHFEFVRPTSFFGVQWD